MPRSIPTRILTLTPDGAVAPDLLQAMERQRMDETTALECAAPLPSPAYRQASATAAAVGLELITRVQPGQELDRHAVATLRSGACASIAVAINGHDDATHDAYQGEMGAFARALHKLELARHLGFDCYVVSHVHKRVAKHLARLSMIPRWLRATAWLVCFGPVCPWGGSGFPLSMDERRGVCAELSDISMTHVQRIAVRCPDYGAESPLGIDSCIDPAVLAALPHHHLTEMPVGGKLAERCLAITCA